MPTPTVHDDRYDSTVAVKASKKTTPLVDSMRPPQSNISPQILSFRCISLSAANREYGRGSKNQKRAKLVVDCRLPLTAYRRQLTADSLPLHVHEE